MTIKQRTTALKKTKAAPVEEIDADISLTQQAYERLQEMIVTLELKPGLMISESQLSKALDLGRTPVREAVQRLQQEGLVEIHRARGIMVPQISIVGHLQLLDVRRQLEPYVSIKASRNATQAQREKMLHLAAQIAHASIGKAPLEFMRINRDIHAIKIEAANNQILKKIMESFYGLSMRFWFAHYDAQPNSLTEAGALHAEILTAISIGDEEKASAKTILLMSFLENFTRRRLEHY
jgi:DNA-binding GntR family transcriptional regulator